ncbi:unnamed protein product [Mytilus coruscus]|uniref:PML C-terminal domain-containing protein n=1 Tax=Mytilus coruscus TaxID=42192 RepID=A0A6J8F3T1_MYTCO|nr:unnamed protein product [Mytilus coruscus]
MKNNLEALIPHQFGDHNLCQPRFCGYKKQPGVKYLHRSLPYKAPLSDPVLRENWSSQACEHANIAASLHALKTSALWRGKLDFRVKASAACINEGRNYLSEVNQNETFISKAASYADLGSSQACEHANIAASLHALKHLHYGESESLDFRVKASAACINEGRNYLSETFKRHALSPGSFTVPYNSKKDNEREKRQNKSKLPEQKLRRLKLKEETITSKGACEATEGTSNESEISFSEQAEDIEKIPDAIPKPLYTAVPSLNNPTVVIIDLETTDFSKVLSTAVYNCNMYDNFTQIVMGFVDSLAVFRSGFPKIEKYNQPFLAQHFCKEEYNAYNAVDDVNMLDKILIAANVTSELLLKQCYHSNSHLLQENFIKGKAKNLPSFHPLIASGVMKVTTAENIAGSGLNCAHLKLIYVRKGEDGLIDVLKKACGKPIVSNDKKLMCSVVQKMGKMFSEL